MGELPAHMTTCVDRQRVWTDSDLACYVCIWRVEHETEEELTATPLHCPYQSHIKDGNLVKPPPGLGIGNDILGGSARFFSI